MALLHQIEAVFQLAVQYGVLLLECAGVAVLLVTAVKSMIGCVKHKPHVRLYLAQGISLALEFKLGGRGAPDGTGPGNERASDPGAGHSAQGGADPDYPLGNQKRGGPDGRGRRTRGSRLDRDGPQAVTAETPGPVLLPFSMRK